VCCSRQNNQELSGSRENRRRNRKVPLALRRGSLNISQRRTMIDGFPHILWSSGSHSPDSNISPFTTIYSHSYSTTQWNNQNLKNPQVETHWKLHVNFTFRDIHSLSPNFIWASSKIWVTFHRYLQTKSATNYVDSPIANLIEILQTVPEIKHADRHDVPVMRLLYGLCVKNV
jgi:hypothetical protein